MSESRSTQSQSLPVLILSSLIGGTVFLLEPAKAAVLNWSELSVGPLARASGLLLPWALASAALAVPGIVLSLLLGARVVAGLLALYVGLWAQGNLLLWAYGPFDGTEIDWSAHHVKGGFELLLWAALFVLALLRTSDLRRHWFAVAILVLALQVAALAQHVAEEFPFDPQPAAALRTGLNAQGCTGAAKDRKSESGRYRQGELMRSIKRGCSGVRCLFSPGRRPRVQGSIRRKASEKVCLGSVRSAVQQCTGVNCRMTDAGKISG